MDSLLKNQSKAMWIDVDTIAHCDVVPMVRNALSGVSSNIIAAVPGDRSPRGFAKGVIKKYNITKSFNAGVYVVDLDKWRAQKLTKQIREIALMNREEKMYKLGSQAPLALAIGDNFERLPWIWNAKVSNFVRDDRQANKDDACILHWSGPEKPWEENGFHKDLWLPYASDGTQTL
jgi:lipopolysaccharide biosynthesis glycosyltransferase